MSSFRLGKYSYYVMRHHLQMLGVCIVLWNTELEIFTCLSHSPHQSFWAFTQTTSFLVLGQLPLHPRSLLLKVQLSCRSNYLLEQSLLASAISASPSCTSGSCLPQPGVGWLVSPGFSGVSSCYVELTVCASALALAQHGCSYRCSCCILKTFFCELLLFCSQSW